MYGGQICGNVSGVRGPLEVAIAVGDDKIMGSVHKAYDCGRRVGLAIAGWVPSRITPERYDGLRDHAAWVKTGAETCALRNHGCCRIARMATLRVAEGQ